MEKWDKFAITISMGLIIAVITSFALAGFALTGYASQGYVIERREFPQDGNVCYTYREVMDCLPLVDKGE